MSDAEALMWTVEKDPTLRSDFLNITLLDRAPDPDRLLAKVATAVGRLPRLRERVVSAPLRLAPPEWVEDPGFDLDYHVRRVAAPAPGGIRQLLDLAAHVAATPFDRARPLWEFVVVEGLEGGRAALFQKLHHTVTDGVGGLRLSLELLDLEREPSELEHETLPADPANNQERVGPLGVLTRAMADAARRPASMASQAMETLGGLARHPGELPGALARGLAAAGSLRQQAFVTGRALSPLMTERSLGNVFTAWSVSLDDVKAAGKALGVTVNDVFVAGVAGGLGRYHDRMGHPVEELRMAMPVSLRSHEDDVGGNRFAPSRVVVPVGHKDPGTLVAAVADRLHDVRAEPALGMVEALAGVVSLLPTSILVPMTRAQVRTIDFTTSNLRGSPVELFLGGARIEANHPMGPRLGAALNVTTLSYGGQLDMGLNLDPAAVTDAEALLECLDEAFSSVISLGA